MVVSSGGMPSSHTALCVAVTTSVALLHGVGGPLFPICLAFSSIIMYDATNVRYHAGVQAEVLNVVVEEMLEGHPISEKKLKELLGHTPLQPASMTRNQPRFVVMLTAAVSVALAFLFLPVTSESVLNTNQPQQPPQQAPRWAPRDPQQWTACNYSTGWWIRKPPSAPYHSTCPFLQDVGPVNCINRPQRPSLSWLGYRWRPATCQVPAYGFRPYHFLEMMRNRVIASVGDSLSYQNLMPSLLCHIHGASPVTEIPNDGSLAIQHKRSRVYRVQAYNVTLINTWSTFLNEYWQDEQ
ncbi:unnamed protein product, partial [Closterium sp. NIES-54]